MMMSRLQENIRNFGIYFELRFCIYISKFLNQSEAQACGKLKHQNSKDSLPLEDSEAIHQQLGAKFSFSVECASLAIILTSLPYRPDIRGTGKPRRNFLRKDGRIQNLPYSLHIPYPGYELITD